jgi:hypothetical protein
MGRLIYFAGTAVLGPMRWKPPRWPGRDLNRNSGLLNQWPTSLLKEIHSPTYFNISISRAWSACDARELGVLLFQLLEALGVVGFHAATIAKTEMECSTMTPKEVS